MSRNRNQSYPMRNERRPEPMMAGAAPKVEPPAPLPVAPADYPDGARFYPTAGTLAESHFGMRVVTAKEIRARGFSPSKFLASNYIRSVPSYA